MSPEDWQAAINEARANLPPPLLAETFHEKLDETYSKPIVVYCNDKRKYIIKGKLVGLPDRLRPLIADQVVGRIGKAIGAPVGEVSVVQISGDFINANPLAAHMSSGMAHGCLWIEDCNPARDGVKYQDVPVNRERFATLAILYGWVVASDHQLYYENTPPNRVHSFDHGLFLPGAQNWTGASLSLAGPPTPDTFICAPCGFVDSDLTGARARLSEITTGVIANAIAAIPVDWGISDADQVALADFLDIRCTQMRL